MLLHVRGINSILMEVWFRRSRARKQTALPFKVTFASQVCSSSHFSLCKTQSCHCKSLSSTRVPVSEKPTVNLLRLSMRIVARNRGWPGPARQEALILVRFIGKIGTTYESVCLHRNAHQTASSFFITAAVLVIGF